ncbi:hypothetical protein [Pandoraea pnomenusa]|uniref:hypothetical protein n=1 Tax=Pandoraea pnomenusa TaxID=93220 RepID=UPI0012DA94E9|nr:hypothetical protein [Pandoraea pnomenusa]
MRIAVRLDFSRRPPARQTFERVVLCDDLSVSRKHGLAQSRAQFATGIEAVERKVQVVDAGTRRTAAEAALAELGERRFCSCCRPTKAVLRAMLDLVHLWMGQPMRAMAA